jgi:PAS domain S-box-containing protein
MEIQPQKRYSIRQLVSDLDDTRTRLREAEDTLNAIRSGAVDGIVVSGPAGEQVFTLQGADHPYRVFVETMHEGAVTISNDGTILYSNQEFAHLLTVPLENLIGQSIRDLVHPDDVSVFDSLLTRADEGATAEVRLRTPGASVVTLFSMRKLLDYETAALCVVVTDLTAQKQQDHLIASEEFSRLVLDHILEAIVVCDDQEQIFRANQAAARLCGTNPVSQSFGRLFPLQFPDRGNGSSPRRLASLAERQEGSPSEATLHRPDGRIFDLLVRVQSLQGHRSGGWVVTMSDLTERKRAETELLKVSKLESLGVLAGGIAHDFNNLLTGLVGNLYLLKMDTKPEAPAFRRLAEAEKACLRARSLTQQLLTFSRGGDPVKKTVAIGPVLLEWASFALRGSNVEVRADIAPDLWSVEADEGQISQVINNLIINAQQAMPGGGHINVRAENVTIDASEKPTLAPGRYVRITFRDEGTGIPLEHLERIFDPFFTTKPTGTGLGLATAYSIIQKHQGHLSVESPSGKGSTFFLHLPASQHTAPPQTDETFTSATPQTGYVLFMDDEAPIRNFVADLLGEIGYRVTCVSTGEEAVEVYRRHFEAGEPFDVVFLDLTIPGGMGGAETIRHLAAIDPAVNAIVSSGYCNDPVIANFSQYGFRDCVIKPYQVEELIEKATHGRRPAGVSSTHRPKSS